MANKNLFQIMILGFITMIVFGSSIVRLITDYLWFSNMGFEDIFSITLKSKISVFAVSAVIFFVFLLINFLISHKLGKGSIPFKLKATIALLTSIFVGLITSNSWLVIKQYLNMSDFNILDPIFTQDVSFYVFTLPFYMILFKFFMFLIVSTIVLVFLDYSQSFITKTLKGPTYANGEIPKTNFKTAFPELKHNAMIHITVLTSLVFVLLGFNHYLSRFSIMFSNKGIVVGAGYTDVVAFLPIATILAVLALVIGVLLYFWVFVIQKSVKLKKRHILLYTFIIYLVLSVIGTSIVPSLIQSFRVSPNEINLEKEYIDYNIDFTKKAYGLDNVDEQIFDVKQELDRSILDGAKGTIDNIRILDWRPLVDTYKQTQEIRLYYDLSNIDIDRYQVDGKYTEVLLSARELDQSQIASNAKTWVNLHMVYTHGYGIVMSPVNSVTSQGLPNYIISDVPPQAEDPGLKIDRPEIYYGEKDNDYVLVNTDTEEFDYPKGNTNEYTKYLGQGGVKLNTFTKKLLFAIRFSDIKILLSSDLNEGSRIMYDRNIQKRINKLTPFISLDSDPYIVTIDGKLFWIQDAYTTSGNYPYSQKIGNINYIRNSVKIIVDAYDGTISYYTDSEPLIDTYSKIFPGMFKSFDDIPEGLVSHLRYPVDYFKIQSEIFNDYHMNDATVFYNKEDAWQIPREVYGTGQQVKVEPYYVIAKLPGETKEEFILMTSFNPIRKDNMVGWLAARSDGENYGKLLLYKFPKDKLIYGPLQIEARIDQDSEISSQLTLWSQQGSRVTRGNLLIIPIENSLLYVEPLYIQAEQGQLPELKRVIVSDGERVVMEENFEKALINLFGKETAVSRGEAPKETQIELISKANELYQAVQDSIKDGDWTGIGTNLDDLGEVLDNLER